MSRHTPIPLSSRLMGWLLFGLPWLLAAAACLPAGALILCGFWELLFRDLRLTLGSALRFFLLPGLHLFLLVRVLRKELPFFSKLMCTLGLWLLLALALFPTLALGLDYHSVQRDSAPERFSAHTQSVEAFQNPELGDYRSAVLHECRHSAPFDSYRSYILVCSYEAEEYLREKAALESRLPFRETPLTYRSFRDDSSCSCPSAIRLGDDLFRFLEFSFDTYTPPFYEHCLIFITNDKTQEICFLSFGESFSDGLEEEIEDFLRNRCCWDAIR